MTPSHPGIEAANNEFMQAVVAGDEVRFVNLYTKDAILLLPGRDPLIGWEGAQTFFASFKVRGIREIKLSTLEVEAFDETAWERGSSVVMGADGAVLGKGKYIVIWKRVADGWKLHREIMNAST
jgi:ketosteroid isomerase-like protein